MIRSSAFAFVFLAATSFQGQTRSLDTKAAATVITTAHAKGTFDGVVVISQNGNTLLAIATGKADRSTGEPLRTETLFRLASLTKQVTALLVMQQVGEGHIHLDQKAGELMPALPEAAARVTVRQLLQHVSGLANPSDPPPGKPLPDDVPPPFYTPAAIDDASNTPVALTTCAVAPKRDPGGSFEYNNCDYIVLGAILETLANKPYTEIVQELIIRPLGLTSWGLFPGNSAKAPRVARAYQPTGKPDLFQNPATYRAAGSLYGNALDVARWNEALLTHKLLSAELTEIMFRADPRLYGEALGSWAYDTKLGETNVHLIERQGDIGSTVLLNLLLPNQNASIIVISNNETPDLFNTYSKKGIAYEILRAIFTH